jgi:uncharacterized protein (TIGR03643 family)
MPRNAPEQWAYCRSYEAVLSPSHLAFANWPAICQCMTKAANLAPEHISDIIQMALSDHVGFQDIRREYGIAEKDVKALMRDNLKQGSYRAWRKRVRDFGDRRENYK